jgi:hypothetical protein
MLGHGHGNPRQLEDLVAMGHPHRLAGLQPFATARAALRPVLEDLVELTLGDELAGRAFMTRLTTWLATRRGTPTPRPLARRFGRGRLR